MLPKVSHEVAVGVVVEMLRAVADGYPDDDPRGACPLGDDLAMLAQENPELVKAIGWLMQEESPEEKMRAGMVGAFVYRLLRAQDEVDALERTLRC
jgi:hypothetical protein